MQLVYRRLRCRLHGGDAVLRVLLALQLCSCTGSLGVAALRLGITPHRFRFGTRLLCRLPGGLVAYAFRLVALAHAFRLSPQLFRSKPLGLLQLPSFFRRTAFLLRCSAGILAVHSLRLRRLPCGLVAHSLFLRLLRNRIDALRFIRGVVGSLRRPGSGRGTLVSRLCINEQVPPLVVAHRLMSDVAFLSAAISVVSISDNTQFAVGYIGVVCPLGHKTDSA